MSEPIGQAIGATNTHPRTTDPNAPGPNATDPGVTDAGATATSENSLSAPTTRTLYIALELGWDTWLLACTTQAAQKPRLRMMPDRDLERLREEIAKATSLR